MMKAKVDDGCVARWEELKMGKALRYIVFNIAEDETIVVEKAAPRDASWDSFLEQLPKDDMRFGVFDFEFVSKEGMHINKLLFVSWSPDSARPKRRMIFASCKEMFKKYVPGVVKDYQATCLEDLSFDDIKKSFDK